MTSIRKHQTATTAINEDDRSTGRIAVAGLLLVLGLLVASATLLNAQEPASSRGSIRPFVGAYIPTGDQRELLKDAVLVGAQGSWNVHRNAAVTGTFGWTPSKDKISAGDQTLDAFQYDLGVEGRVPRWISGYGFTPFIGAGVGSRTYSYRDLNVDSKTNVDGYGAVGFDLDVGPLGLRLEARDYVSQFKPFAGGETVTRNDVAIMAGLGLHF